MTEFPPAFFDRADEGPDSAFYAIDRFVTHIDDDAIAAVGALYRELGLTGEVLDICSSWVSHFEQTPRRLVAMGMNANELARNTAASDTLVGDLNVEPVLPFEAGSFDAVTCCASIDYLTRPVEVFAEAARVLRPGGVLVITFSNRCFPTKAIRGWLSADDDGRCQIVATYFASVDRFGPPNVQLRTAGMPGDPLYAVWATTLPAGVHIRPATPDDQTVISDMQYEALFVPNGAEPLPRSIVDEPNIRPYHAEFGASPGDIGRIARDDSGAPTGAAWVRQVEGYGFVDHATPELSVAVVAGHRGAGVGTALLESLLAAVPRVSLSVDTRNPAMALYRRIGFELVRIDGEHTAVMLRSEAAA